MLEMAVLRHDRRSSPPDTPSVALSRGQDPELTFPAPIEGSFDELDARSHVGDQCHPILDVATAEDPNRFVRPGRLSVVLGLAWFIARISLPAYMIRDNRYGGICGFSVADHH
jgi:hypothetical protein